MKFTTVCVRKSCFELFSWFKRKLMFLVLLANLASKTKNSKPFASSQCTNRGILKVKGASIGYLFIYIFIKI